MVEGLKTVHVGRHEAHELGELVGAEGHGRTLNRGRLGGNRLDPRLAGERGRLRERLGLVVCYP